MSHKAFLGRFDTVEQASNAYLEYKSKLLKELISQQTDQRVINGLNKHLDIMNENILVPK